MPKRAHTKKGTYQNEHIPKKAHTKKGTYQKGHIPKRAHTENSPYPKGPSINSVVSEGEGGHTVLKLILHCHLGLF
jgi:hypothetical protein